MCSAQAKKNDERRRWRREHWLLLLLLMIGVVFLLLHWPDRIDESYHFPAFDVGAPNAPAQPEKESIIDNESVRPTPSPRMGKKNSGQLDRLLIDRVVKRHQHKIRSCYDQVLQRGIRASGKLVFQWVIEDSGAVRGVELAADTLENDLVRRCVSGVLVSMRFPATHTGRRIRVVYPFRFVPLVQE